MKKIFLGIFLGSILILSGCNNQPTQSTGVQNDKIAQLEEQVQTMQAENQKLNEEIAGLKKQNQQLAQEATGPGFGGGGPNQNLPKPTTSSAETKTYANNTYGYSISYPSDWYVDGSEADKPMVGRGSDNGLIGGDLYVSNYPNPTQYNMDNEEPNDFQLMTMMVYPKNDSQNLTDFMRNKHYFDCDYSSLETYQACDEYKNGNVTNTTINNLNAITFVRKFGNAIVAGILIEKSDKIFYFNYNKPLNLNAEDDILLKVAISFKGQ